MKTQTAVLLTFLLTLSLSCTKKGAEGGAEDGDKFFVKEVTEGQQDISIPKKLWDDLEAIYKPMAGEGPVEGGGEGGGHGGGEAPPAEHGGGGEAPAAEHGTGDDSDNLNTRGLLKKRPPIDQITLYVEMTEVTPGLLEHPKIRLKYPAGGGDLDFRKFLSQRKNGTFNLRVGFESEMPIDDTKIFLLSNSKIREVNGKSFGNGCNRYLEITSYWNKIMKKSGVELNTFDQRHVSLMAGTFFFACSYRGKIRMTHLAVTDSRFREHLCPGH